MRRHVENSALPIYPGRGLLPIKQAGMKQRHRFMRVMEHSGFVINETRT
jgi:hypothetical protein